MSDEMVAAFTVQMAQLRQALAEADSLAAGEQTLPAAQALAATFAGASEAERLRYLLRALDDAIAAQEVAARVADELHGAGIGAPTREALEGEADPLRAAYQAYVESQPAYQALYQFRNALALRLRVAALPLPDTISAAASAPRGDGTTHEQPPAKSRRARKETSQQ